MLPGWHREGTPSPGKDRALPTRSPGDPADPDPSRARWTFIPRLRKLRAGHGCTQKNNKEPFLVWPQSALLPSSHFQWEISDYFGDPGGSLMLPPPGLAMAARAASPPLPSCSPRSGSGLGLPLAPLSCQGLCVLLEARGFSSPGLQPSIIISFIVAFFALPLPVLGLGPVPRAPFVFEWVCLCWAGVCGAAPGAAPGAQQSSPDGAGMAWPLVRLWELIPGSSGSSRV